MSRDLERFPTKVPAGVAIAARCLRRSQPLMTMVMMMAALGLRSAGGDGAADDTTNDGHQGRRAT